MPRVSAGYRCEACGARSAGPLGRCAQCGAWGTVVAEVASDRRAPRSSGLRATRLGDVSDLAIARIPSGMGEVDRVLGGGWVAGAAILLAGEPGIGKSTLLLQLADAAIRSGRSSLLVCGEESPAQVKLRAQRLGVSEEVRLLRSTEAEGIATFMTDTPPELIIVDSIQTLSLEGGGAPGSVTAVRDATALLTQAAKSCGSTLVLIGHVTKQGTIAGPKVVEHVVDVTLALETAAGFRVLRGIKNRFGAAGEVGVFEMTGRGMVAVPNPSDAFLAERPLGVPGSVVVAALEGQRPLLVEVQALAAASPYSSPRRVVQGFDARRVDLILAVLERRMALPLQGLDIFVNVAGGLRLTDPGADLAVAIAVASAVTNRVVAAQVALFGEVGLAGELRSVAQGGRRAAEALRSGHPRPMGPGGPSEAHAWQTVANLHEAFAALWGST
jgi:DNA repair protein RadA/Sms